MSDVVTIAGTLDELRPIAPRTALQNAKFALEYIEQFGFLAEALKGNETTHGAKVLQRELAKAHALLTVVLAS